MSNEEKILRSLELLKDFGYKSDSIKAIKHLPAQEGSFRDYPDDVHPALRGALEAKGFTRLYSHQRSTWEALKEGKNVVVVTPTASGKTLCYNLPVLDAIMKDPSARALYLFPTKALSQDQQAELDDINGRLPEEIRVFTYDGDTPQDARKAIRARGHIVLTNPDMLHAGILPHHTKWIKLFENLKYIVIDELHNYRGIFGSHLANVLRRLKRIARFYGADPQFILCTATIANPAEMAEKMIEAPVTLVDDNGAPRGGKYFVFYTPPVVNAALGIRRSYVNESRRVASIFLRNGLQTIVFAGSRLITEVLLTYLKEDIETNIQKEGLIRGYRGGYLPLKRREIEKGLRTGEILGVVSTNALELGIDIGTLDVAVLAGYPGTIASTWQRAGRAGRKTGLSAAVLVATSSPLDQFIINNPEYFFSKSPEMALINPDNLSILISHIECAAFELPFEDGEKFGRAEIGGDPQLPRGGQDPPPLQGQVVLHVGGLPGRRHQPAQHQLGQLRRRRHHRRGPGHRRGRFHVGAHGPAPQGHLHRRGRAVFRREARLRGAQGLRQENRHRLLHRRHRLHQDHHPRRLRQEGRSRPGRAASPTARSTWRRRSSGSRRSSSTRWRTSARATSSCRRTRCTRRPTG